MQAPADSAKRFAFSAYATINYAHYKWDTHLERWWWWGAMALIAFLESL